MKDKVKIRPALREDFFSTSFVTLGNSLNLHHKTKQELLPANINRRQVYPGFLHVKML